MVVIVIHGLPGGSDGKGSACNAGDLGSIPGLGRSLGEGNGNHSIVSLPGELHGPRSLAGCSAWGHKELDMTDGLKLKLKQRPGRMVLNEGFPSPLLCSSLRTPTPFLSLGVSLPHFCLKQILLRVLATRFAVSLIMNFIPVFFFLNSFCLLETFLLSNGGKN